MRLVLIGTLLRKRPTSALAITFHPPSVEDREIDNTIKLSLLARRATGFERASRRVHPDIYTRNKTTRQLHVVIFEEDNLAKELRHA